MEYKLAVVGSPSSIMIYRALGCETHEAFTQQESREQTEKLFRAVQEDEAASPQYAVVFVEENHYKEFPEDLIEKFSRKALPAVIPVPSPTSGNDNFAGERLRKIVERAVGSDILG